MSDTNQGYSVIDGVFERSEMVGILAALDEADCTRSKAGVRHVLRIPAVRQLAEDSRLLRIAARFVGADAFPFRATLFDKSIASNWLVAWHQDTALPVRDRVDEAGWGPWSNKGGVLHAIAPASALHSVIALRVHLDSSTEANGPLRVLPRSHARGVLTHDQIERLAETVMPVRCTGAAGTVIAMRPLTVHASSKAQGDGPRRVLQIEYASNMKFGDIELAVG